MQIKEVTFIRNIHYTKTLYNSLEKVPLSYTYIAKVYIHVKYRKETLSEFRKSETIFKDFIFTALIKTLRLLKYLIINICNIDPNNILKCRLAIEMYTNFRLKLHNNN